jgi:hypothetical protein
MVKMEAMAAATRSPVELFLHIEDTTGDTTFADFVGRLINPNTDPEARSTCFKNAADVYSPSLESMDPQLDSDPTARKLAATIRDIQLLEYLDEVGAGPEAHVAAAFAGQYLTIPGEIVQVIE